MKRKCSLLFATVLLLSLLLSTTILANDGIVRNNIGVGEVDPKNNNSVGTYGVDTPSSSKIWNLATQGRYDFSGSANNSYLYTNYRFTGKTSYGVYVQNRHASKTLTVTPMSSGNTYQPLSVPAGSTKAYTFTVNSTSDRVYLRFSYPSDFTGWIK